VSDPAEAAWRRCWAARPDVAVPLDRFVAHLAAHRPPELSLADQLATWCLDDIYLAIGCIARDPAAVAAFDREIVPLIDLALTGWDRAIVDETRQQLRAMLLVDNAGRGPLLAQYAGRGALRRWVRVVAAREAGKTLRADRAALPVADAELFDRLAPATDPQVSAIKNEAAAAFRTAFVAALGELPARERAVLRLHVLDGLTIDDIAPLYTVHRATIARWIAAAKQSVLDRTRKKLMHDLRIGADELDSLIRLIHSRIELPEDALR
jgi:RNA polymerase sigma-70 factor, ECF subfamily